MHTCDIYLVFTSIFFKYAIFPSRSLRYSAKRRRPSHTHSVTHCLYMVWRPTVLRTNVSAVRLIVVWVNVYVCHFNVFTFSYVDLAVMDTWPADNDIVRMNRQCVFKKMIYGIIKVCQGSIDCKALLAVLDWKSAI